MKVLVIDDHALFRAGLRLLIQSIQPNIEVFEAGGIQDALTLLHLHPQLRLCLLDIHLSDENGLQAVSQIKSAAPSISVVVISAECNLQTVLNSITAGAMGFIPKRAQPSELSSALLRVLSGEISIPKNVIDADTNPQNRNTPILSRRQWDVFHCLMRGLPNKLICRELNLSENTVKSHLTAIFRTFDVHTRTQLVLAASQLRSVPNQQQSTKQ